MPSRSAPQSRGRSYMKRLLTCKLSGNEVYNTNSLSLLVENMLWSEFHCQKVFFKMPFHTRSLDGGLTKLTNEGLKIIKYNPVVHSVQRKLYKAKLGADNLYSWGASFAPPTTNPAVWRIWHRWDSQGQILALAFRWKSLNPLIPSSLGSAPPRDRTRDSLPHFKSSSSLKKKSRQGRKTDKYRPAMNLHWKGLKLTDVTCLHEEIFLAVPMRVFALERNLGFPVKSKSILGTKFTQALKLI